MSVSTDYFNYLCEAKNYKAEININTYIQKKHYNYCSVCDKITAKGICRGSKNNNLLLFFFCVLKPVALIG